MNQLINNQITETDINTRKELWDSLFLFINFQGLKSEFPNMWSKDYNLIPLPNSYKETREKLTKYCQELNSKLEQLINSPDYTYVFKDRIYPLLNKPDGDKTLLFRCDRLLKNKILGESSSLFTDLVIWEIEYRQVKKFKEWLMEIAGEVCFEKEEEDEVFEKECKKLAHKRSKINYSLAQRFYWKWTKLIEKQGTKEVRKYWKELVEYLKQWEQGKGAKSEWKIRLEDFSEKIEKFFLLGSENISDGKPFFQLGFIKSDTETGLIVSTQNRKGFSLNNPSLAVINFHQKFFRVYRIENYQHINPRNLYVELFLKEDWVWKDYPLVVHGLGGLNSNNHPIYHKRNLG